MAETVYGIRSLRLYELLSAPMVAMLQANSEAAKSTLEYIEMVGFQEPAVPAAETQPTLRMASFRYHKLDENNEYSEFETQVPVLSLVPIPSLQIKEATVKLSAKITDVADESTTTNVTDRGALVSNSRILGSLRASRKQLIAKPAASSSTKERDVREAYHLEIEITLGQADVTLGMERLFNLMDLAIRDKRVSGQ